MKLMIASDIHGSAFYCRKMLDAYRNEHAGRLLLLGDILYHGPRNPLPEEYNPAAVAEMLNELSGEILCVRGNCDSDVDQMVLNFPIMAEYCAIFTGEHLIYATHGHTYNELSLPPLGKGDILLHGHTHVPKCTEHENYICMNPGSTSIPKEDSPNGYMLLDGAHFEWKTLDGEVYMEYTLK